MEYVKSFGELEVYKLSRQLSKQIFEVTSRFYRDPKEEMYSLTDQIRRSSRSIGAQIAEAWAKLANDLLQQCAAVGKMLNSMINKAESFCNKNIVSQEPITEY